ncbi:type II secretion system F family protein [Sphingomonas swuensis]|uniref:Type II secretion system F family protein n=1 Tax=Sphingomonas swuensis TaxID=977800 RepID=A0ABP7SW53_9SPHN
MADNLLRVLILVLVFAAVLMVVETLIRGIAQSRGATRAINTRLKMIGRGSTRAETLGVLRRHNLDTAGKMPGLLRPAVRSIERTLMATGLRLPTSQLLAILVAAPLVVMAVIVVLLLAAGIPLGFGPALLIATVSLALGFFIPLLILRAKAQKRIRKMQEQFPVALDVFVRGLRAGHPVAAALDLLTVEMPDPIGTQFGIVVDEVTYGAEMRDSLFDLAERWDLDDMRMFVVCLSVQNESGGNLAEILENLSKVIRDRAAMLMKVRALSSEGRMTAVILSLLPVLTFGGLFLLNARFYLEVAQDPVFVPGFMALIVLYFIGFFTIRRMVDLKV